MGLFVDYSRGEAVYLWGSSHELSTPEKFVNLTFAELFEPLFDFYPQRTF